MKQSFRLVNLGCANCAAKMESAIKKLPGVSRVGINFMTTRMVIEADDQNMESIIESASKIIKKIEPDVQIKKA